ncbi:ArsA family ATPase [Salsuginibacillus kocurii]|uniref:ArsA family ATPase n=1 Tax=Salsuginibacillus kocurii TaxID=427078 RepID=UPI000376CD30|nr:ArsA family ATPase [Salsuginibacillus kocurii]
MQKLFKHEIVFFGGKGGVGKSTTSSAFAWKAARSGKKTLLVSTDPAHNLGDIFNQRLNGNIEALADNLYAIEIDPEQESRAYIERVKSNLDGLVKSNLLEEVHRQIDMASVSPGAEEAALFDRLVQLVLEELDTFELIVFDTAPTGHTVRLLALPEMMEAWVEGMLQRRQSVNETYAGWLEDGTPTEDPIYRTLMERKDRFSRAREVLLNPKRTGYVYTLIPERLPIVETKRALELLKHTGISVQTLVINKCLPEAAAESPFFKKRKEQENAYLAEIKQTFNQQGLVHLPLLESDIRSTADLEELAGQFK